MSKLLAIGSYDEVQKKKQKADAYRQSTTAGAVNLPKSGTYDGMRQRVRDALGAKTSPLDTKNLFNDIDDAAIERSIPIAEATIETNKNSGLDVSRYPYLKDGLTLFYAAGEVGNSSEMQKAKRAAYTPETTKLIYKPNGDNKPEMTLFSEENKLNVFNSEGVDSNSINRISNKMSKKTITADEAETIFNRSRNSAYSLTEQERAVLTGLMNNPATPITKKKEIEGVLSRENARIKPLDEETEKNSNKSFEENLREIVENKMKEANTVANEGITKVIKKGLPILNDKANEIMDNNPQIRDFVNGIIGVDTPKSNGDPERNYEDNKKLDLQESGAMEGKYINEQGKLGDYKLGQSNIAISGCGTIATYNVLQGIGVDANFADVIHNSETSTLLRGNLGMSPNGIIEILKNNGCEVTNDWLGVDENFNTEGCDAVVHLYLRRDGTAHYVAGIDAGDGKYRFYNSDTDDTTPMTWEEYYNKNIDEDVLYSCTINVRKKDDFGNTENQAL